MDLSHSKADGATAGLSSSRESVSYGLPCANCHLYYPASLDSCPWCHSKERVSAALGATCKTPAAAVEASADDAALQHERDAFLQHFKSQFHGGATEITKTPAMCALSPQHPESIELASFCKPCYERLQQRVDVLEAALHIDLKEAAQIVYQAVWSDPSDPAKTYANAAAALLTELRKRSGVSSVLAPFQHRGN
jgi:hypothetical protein